MLLATFLSGCFWHLSSVTDVPYLHIHAHLLTFLSGWFWGLYSLLYVLRFISLMHGIDYLTPCSKPFNGSPCLPKKVQDPLPETHGPSQPTHSILLSINLCPSLSPLNWAFPWFQVPIPKSFPFPNTTYSSDTCSEATSSMKSSLAFQLEVAFPFPAQAQH